ncbi:hypothetical protein B0H63DRAFT_433 [Podospora didyma]|uniref:Uncharacterized protein n=1 Tax=Podospora didyma TaxID=330526 RepID=A0AAE0U6I2_9PEZI|nr:hypothetical protein B0H63DRAFT_433 [Podospora didyma]
MRILVNASSAFSRAAAIRTFASHANSTPHPAAAGTIDTLHVWRNIYEQDAPNVDEARFGTASPRAANWKYWDAPETSIDERTARTYRAPSASSTSASGTANGTMHAVTGEVKGNPTESEADVWADRIDDDPLPPEKHKTIRLPAGDLAPKPTDAEAGVRADRSEEDPLPRVKK